MPSALHPRAAIIPLIILSLSLGCQASRLAQPKAQPAPVPEKAEPEPQSFQAPEKAETEQKKKPKTEQTPEMEKWVRSFVREIMKSPERKRPYKEKEYSEFMEKWHEEAGSLLEKYKKTRDTTALEKALILYQYLYKKTPNPADIIRDTGSKRNYLPRVKKHWFYFMRLLLIYYYMGDYEYVNTVLTDYLDDPDDQNTIPKETKQKLIKLHKLAKEKAQEIKPKDSGTHNSEESNEQSDYQARINRARIIFREIKQYEINLTINLHNKPDADHWVRSRITEEDFKCMHLFTEENLKKYNETKDESNLKLAKLGFHEMYRILLALYCKGEYEFVAENAASMNKSVQFKPLRFDQMEKSLKNLSEKAAKKIKNK
ncbi:MAG: hypothetical protein E3J72_16885 [Planctomycetota bacterium]|nr:MAG: hypothetical protein E3J72_16885 [Planctomycetota bacterium]